MKRIEPGCLAIVLGGKFTGRVVRVIEFIGDLPEHPCNWHLAERVKKNIWLCHADWIRACPEQYAPEFALMRIDDDGELEKEDREQEQKIYEKYHWPAEATDLKWLKEVIPFELET